MVPHPVGESASTRRGWGRSRRALDRRPVPCARHTAEEARRPGPSRILQISPHLLQANVFPDSKPSPKMTPSGSRRQREIWRSPLPAASWTRALTPHSPAQVATLPARAGGGAARQDEEIAVAVDVGAGHVLHRPGEQQPFGPVGHVGPGGPRSGRRAARPPCEAVLSLAAGQGSRIPRIGRRTQAGLTRRPERARCA